MISPYFILYRKFVKPAPLIGIVASNGLVTLTLCSIRCFCILAIPLRIDESFPLEEIFWPSWILSIRNL